jgi:hypothetical protein
LNYGSSRFKFYDLELQGTSFIGSLMGSASDSVEAVEEEVGLGVSAHIWTNNELEERIIILGPEVGA